MSHRFREPCREQTVHLGRLTDSHIWPMPNRCFSSHFVFFGLDLHSIYFMQQWIKTVPESLFILNHHIHTNLWGFSLRIWIVTAKMKLLVLSVCAVYEDVVALNGHVCTWVVHAKGYWRDYIKYRHLHLISCIEMKKIGQNTSWYSFPDN